MKSKEQINNVPRDMRRRLALAHLLSIPFALFGFEALEAHKGLDLFLSQSPTTKRAEISLTECRRQLFSYWKQNHTTTAVGMLREIYEWIEQLEEEIVYGGKEQRAITMWYLCHYHMVFANVVRDLQDYEQAITHLNKAHQLAGHLKDSRPVRELKVLVFHRRGIALQERGDLIAAAQDFKAAQSLLTAASPQLHGAVLSSLGYAQAHLAQSRKDFYQALHLIDQSTSWIEQGKGEDEHFVKFGEERYHLDKAAAYLASPLATLCSPKDARRELREALTDPSLKRRYAYNTILQAKSYVAEGEYEQAITRAEEALTIAIEIQSKINISRVAQIYKKVQESPYAGHDDVMHLGVTLLRGQYPEIFA
ncbi:hypothetical protein EPA93_07185 [Ktedonosporobacter rubrisoli]|uniref:Tetratricopeptide repeat protein n=1 Tax=Ktedonosporobacter rubrisoli TaxID=2509675 RepID=A0A4V0YYD1_KTERU|nr:hypothetical protein [Ktedonosporobacter rubrisoli]QBD75801.1 hypothetical protein EPA93_07185 [Ktedonosporobacter rubrisoli]